VFFPPVRVHNLYYTIIYILYYMLLYMGERRRRCLITLAVIFTANKNTIISIRYNINNNKKKFFYY